MVRYRLSGGDAWRVYDSARPPELIAPDTIIAYSRDLATGERSIMGTARYTFDRLPSPVSAVTVNADGDGLSDAWEQVFSIEDPNTDTDTDGDGANALAEYRRGTDPRDAGSRPTDTPAPEVEIAVVSVQEGRIHLVWPAESHG